MKSVLNFIVKPLNESRYNNKKNIGDKELILNTDIFSHKFVNRHAIVVEVPSVGETKIKKGDLVIVHHNVFRRWNDVRGKEKDSKSYYKDDMYFVYPDQIFLYKNKNEWKANDSFCFVKPMVWVTHRIHRIHRIRCHRLQHGTPLPHAPGVKSLVLPSKTIVFFDENMNFIA